MQLLEFLRRRDVYDTILLFLYVHAAVAIYRLGADALVTFAVATATAVLLDSAIYRLRRRATTPRNLRKALITSAFVGFLVPWNAPLFVSAAASSLAILSKHVVRLPKKKHVFNPAAFGAFLASQTFVLPTSWWGAETYVTWLLGLLLIYKFSRLELPFSLLLSYGLLSTAGFYAGLPTSTIDQILRFNAPLVMLAFFMATEPVTSPYTRGGRVVFGVVTGVAIFALGFVPGRFDTLLAGLLVANVFTQPINRLSRQFQRKQITAR